MFAKSLKDSFEYFSEYAFEVMWLGFLSPSFLNDKIMSGGGLVDRLDLFEIFGLKIWYDKLAVDYSLSLSLTLRHLLADFFCICYNPFCKNKPKIK